MARFSLRLSAFFSSFFYPYLTLRKHDASLDEEEDLALMNILLGFPLDDFASTLERDACEGRALLNHRLADMLAQESMKDLQRGGSQDPAATVDEEEKQSMLIKCQNLLKQFSLSSGSTPAGGFATKRSVVFSLLQTFGLSSFKCKNVTPSRRSVSIPPAACILPRSKSLPMSSPRNYRPIIPACLLTKERRSSKNTKTSTGYKRSAAKNVCPARNR